VLFRGLLVAVSPLAELVGALDASELVVAWSHSAASFTSLHSQMAERVPEAACHITHLGRTDDTPSVSQCILMRNRHGGAFFAGSLCN